MNRFGEKPREQAVEIKTLIMEVRNTPGVCHRRAEVMTGAGVAGYSFTVELLHPHHLAGFNRRISNV